jgi:hypothetical protein
VIGLVPVGALLETVRVKCAVPDPGTAIEEGVKLPVTPDGTPVADKAIAELKPPETVVVTMTYPLLPRFRYPDVGETEMVKAPAAGVVTVSDTVAVCVIPLPVPVTVIVWVPAAVVEATARVKVDVPVPVMEAGLKLAVTPLGWPLAVKVTAESKPSRKVEVMVDLPLLPCTTVTEAGDAERVKVGDVTAGARALSRPVPLGLPQPVTRS